MSTNLEKDFHPEMVIKSKVFPKKQFQKILTQFRQGGFAVEKVEGGYTVHAIGKQSKILVLKAMSGVNGYLARFDETIFIYNP